MRRKGRALKRLLVVLAVLAAALLVIYIYHRVRLGQEAALLTPPGKLVEVDGHTMSVYVEGEGENTLVFLSGGGTCAPILDFKSLYAQLSDQYKIAVVERFGYGFSQVVDRPRDIDTVLSDTRAALTAAGVEGPYVLCPHSMSGLEALYWAKTYPDEVSAIVGLDMAVPEYYDGMKINLPLMRLMGWGAKVGITRLIPGVAESDAIRHGTLTQEEQAQYRALFYRRTATASMLAEAEVVRENARRVADLGVPQLPILLFLSDGSGGTGFDKETWRSIAIAYLSQVEGGRYMELDCPHYVHDYEYERIAQEIAAFLDGV